MYASVRVMIQIDGSHIVILFFYLNPSLEPMQHNFNVYKNSLFIDKSSRMNENLGKFFSTAGVLAIRHQVIQVYAWVDNGIVFTLAFSELLNCNNKYQAVRMKIYPAG